MNREHTRMHVGWKKTKRKSSKGHKFCKLRIDKSLNFELEAGGYLDNSQDSFFHYYEIHLATICSSFPSTKKFSVSTCVPCFVYLPQRSIKHGVCCTPFWHLFLWFQLLLSLIYMWMTTYVCVKYAYCFFHKNKFTYCVSSGLDSIYWKFTMPETPCPSLSTTPVPKSAYHSILAILIFSFLSGTNHTSIWTFLDHVGILGIIKLMALVVAKTKTFQWKPRKLFVVWQDILAAFTGP